MVSEGTGETTFSAMATGKDRHGGGRKGEKVVKTNTQDGNRDRSNGNGEEGEEWAGLDTLN